ncbi:MAG: hypothetical protein U0531_08770 [Dehalococcoidia bacterium]
MIVAGCGGEPPGGGAIRPLDAPPWARDLRRIEDIVNHPDLLPRAVGPADLHWLREVARRAGWRQDTGRRGRDFRIYDPAGGALILLEFPGRSNRHGPNPYWKVGGLAGTRRIRNVRWLSTS